MPRFELECCSRGMGERDGGSTAVGLYGILPWFLLEEMLEEGNEPPDRVRSDEELERAEEMYRALACVAEGAGGAACFLHDLSHQTCRLVYARAADDGEVKGAWGIILNAVERLAKGVERLTDGVVDYVILETEVYREKEEAVPEESE